MRALQDGRQERGKGTALAETHHAVDAAGLADRVGDGGDALVQEAVRARGLVLAPPGPGVDFLVLAVGGLVGDKAWDVARREL